MRNVLLLTAILFLCSCGATPVPTPTDLTTRPFPVVRGSNLNQKEVTLPDDFKGSVTVVLVGYQQRAQFDIDRWILGLLQANAPVKIVEVPTIAGMVPQMVQGFIDSGMRSGIPKEDWASVVTVYEDASKIVEAIGNERPQSAHVLLLNKNGEIAWSSNRGYSAAQVLELSEVATKLSR